MSKDNSLLRFFPTPDFLEMPSIGLDISDGFIRIIEFVDTSKGKELGRYGKISLPKDVVFKGEIKNKIKLVKILEKIKENFNFDFVRVSIIEKSSYIFKTRIPKTKNMTRDEVYGSLRFNIEENVPMRPEDVVFDFDILGGDTKHLDVVVSVLPKKIVNEFIEVFNEVDITPLSFEVEAHAISRSSIAEGDNGTFMVVDFGSTRVSISIVSEGLVQLTSTFDIGGDDLVEAIRKHLNISKEAAKRIKNEKGFVKIDSNEELFFAMMNTIAALKDEMNKYLIYWHSHKDNTKQGKVLKKVEKIILCGENGALKGLDDYLSLSIGLKVEKAKVWRNIFTFEKVVPEIPAFDSLEYAAAIGLAMRSDGKIFLSNKIPENK